MASKLRFRPRVFPLEEPVDGDRLLAALGALRGAAFLDSAGGEPRRWSLFAFEPLRELLVAAGDTSFRLADLRRALSVLRREPGDEVPGPFAGGFLGALAYDLGADGEAQRLPADPWGSPRLVGGLYVDFVVVDHRAQQAWLVLGAEPGDGRPPLARRRERLLRLLHEPPSAPSPRPSGPLVRHLPGEVHRRRIELLRARIAAGDLYQANLAHRFTRSMHGAPHAIQRELRRHHPAPWAFYASWGARAGARRSASTSRPPAGALLSTSPELLLECDGARLRTRPIKGTRARGRDPADDEAQRASLLASEKERAELSMIVDLERNDLGRVARLGSVRVEGMATIESYATVHHLVADVCAELAPGRDAVDALAALFPGGSISGAPKLAAMAAIAELEGEGRGFFTGSAGFLGLDGRAGFNVLIRSLVWRPAGRGAARDPLDGEVAFHVGGGITWGSEAWAEEQETLDKGAALAAALEGSRRAASDPDPCLTRAIGVP